MPTETVYEAMGNYRRAAEIERSIPVGAWVLFHEASLQPRWRKLPRNYRLLLLNGRSQDHRNIETPHSTAASTWFQWEAFTVITEDSIIDSLEAYNDVAP